MRREALARAQIERYAVPPRRRDVDPNGRVGFRAAVWIDARLLTVGDARRAVDGARGVLAAHHVLRLHRLDRLQDLALGIAHGLLAEILRRLHRHHREDLEEMVGHHVAKRPGALVEAAAPLDPSTSAAVIWT